MGPPRLSNLSPIVRTGALIADPGDDPSQSAAAHSPGDPASSITATRPTCAPNASRDSSSMSPPQHCTTAGRNRSPTRLSPGDTIRYVAKIEHLDDAGASISGRVLATGDDLVAEIEMMFSHIDKNLAGIEFPEHNFVFTEQFTELVKMFKLDPTVKI